MKRTLESIISLIFVVTSLTALLPAESLAADEVCIYSSQNGQQKTVDSRYKVPNKYRDNMKCLPVSEAQQLPSPDEVKLSGNIRRENMLSPIGKIALQWPRHVESLFGRTPRRAMNQAAITVARTLRTAAFPSRVQNLDLEWNIVFMDEDAVGTQVPTYFVTNCHPGWMTPPANIYVVAQRVVAGCSGRKPSGSSVADAQLEELLVHELGHAVEYYVLGKEPNRERMRAEGFATWFETYAAKQSPTLDANEIRVRTFAMAKESFREYPTTFEFQGSGFDYARAAMYFHAVENARGVRGLMEVYDFIGESKENLVPAIQKTMQWNEERLNQEVKKLLQ